MVVNLGIGLDPNVGNENGDEQTNGIGAADGDGDVEMSGGGGGGDATNVAGEAAPVDGEDAGAEEVDDNEYGARALIDTVIEDREERLSDEDIGEILKIVRDVFGENKSSKEAG